MWPRLPADKERNEYDLGIAADQFLIYGMGEYAWASSKIEYFDFALKLFDSVYTRYETGNYKSAPHHLPPGYKSHGKPMILLETAQELSEVARCFNHPSAFRLQAVAGKSMAETINTFIGKMHFAKRVSGQQALHTAVAPENKEEHMLEELTESWDNKLWGVHSEALYALILAYENTSDSWFLDTYWKFNEYVFTTFPNPNQEIGGGWIQIRDRRGNLEEKVVALPVKDPYHITRAFMHIIKSLERLAAR